MSVVSGLVEERADVLVSPADDEDVPALVLPGDGGVADTEPDTEPEAEGELPGDGDVPADDEEEPESGAPGVVDGAVAVDEDELLGAVEVAGGGVVVVEEDELDVGGGELGGGLRLSLLSQAANPSRHADTATISFMVHFSFIE